MIMTKSRSENFSGEASEKHVLLSAADHNHRRFVLAVWGLLQHGINPLSC